MGHGVAMKRNKTFPLHKLRGPSLSAFLLTALALTVGATDARIELTTAAANTAGSAINVADDLSVQQELNIFNTVTVPLREALASARKLHANAILVDASFDGSPQTPVFRVKSYGDGSIWEDAFDAFSGKTVGNTITTAVNDLGEQDRRTLASVWSAPLEPDRLKLVI
jgi:hypothetical protein